MLLYHCPPAQQYAPFFRHCAAPGVGSPARPRLAECASMNPGVDWEPMGQRAGEPLNFAVIKQMDPALLQRCPVTRAFVPASTNSSRLPIREPAGYLPNALQK